jgi:hypothetical protein
MGKPAPDMLRQMEPRDPAVIEEIKHYIDLVTHALHEGSVPLAAEVVVALLVTAAQVVVPAGVPREDFLHVAGSLWDRTFRQHQGRTA